MTACPIVVIMSDSGQVPKAEDESTDGGAVEDELDSTGMTVGTYRRMHAQIEAEGRQSLSSEALARYDAADAEMSAAVQRVREIASQHAKLPSVAEDLRQQFTLASTVDFEAMYESIARVGIPPAERLGREALASLEQAEKWKPDWMKQTNPDTPVRPAEGFRTGSVGSQLAGSPVDESLLEGMAEAKDEREAAEAAHRAAELEALAKIGGTMEAMQLEQRGEAVTSGKVARWGVGLMALTLIVATASLVIAL